jgi:hypothetical protein
MGESKQLRSPELGVIFQITEVEAPTGERLWEIHDVERNRGFRLSMTREALSRLATEGGIAGAPNDATMETAILAALERA